MRSPGSGGAGEAVFPAGRKWRSCGTRSDVRYVCATERRGPGSFMDRSIMEGDPHSVLEGMIIGAFAIGRTRIHLRAQRVPSGGQKPGMPWKRPAPADSWEEHLYSGMISTCESIAGAARSSAAIFRLMASLEGRAGSRGQVHSHG